MKEKVKEKQYAYITLNDSRTDEEKEENKAKYMVAKKIAKTFLTCISETRE